MGRAQGRHAGDRAKKSGELLIHGFLHIWREVEWPQSAISVGTVAAEFGSKVLPQIMCLLAAA
jgi:hypothetical protein